MSVGPVLESIPRPPPSGAPSSRAAPAAAASDAPSLFARLLHGLGREVASGEATIRNAVAATQSGRDLGPGQLIALQAGVYRYSEAVDLAAKLVDRATSAVRTIVQGGGQ
jgi:hypothetical protein